MLKKLNTYYFLKIVFSFMNEGRKLKTVKYNKTLQNISIEILLIINYLKEIISFMSVTELQRNILVMMIHYYS